MRVKNYLCVDFAFFLTEFKYIEIKELTIMHKISIAAFLTVFISLMFLVEPVNAEEIHFSNDVYTLKYSAIAPQTEGYGNEYFLKNEDVGKWTKMIGVYYYPKESNPLKFAENFDKTVENTENSVLLKLIENKKADKAAISFLVNGCENAKKYFEYNIYKFEKSPVKGMVVLKYAVKHYFTNNDEIKSIAENIKKENDKYLETIITSPIPTIIEKNIPAHE